jgi:excisionase family DNA binding protein
MLGIDWVDDRCDLQWEWSGPMAGDSSTPLLTIDEVRSRLNVSISTVRRLVRDRKLRAYRVGGRLRFKPEEVAAYIDSQLVGAAIPERDMQSP